MARKSVSTAFAEVLELSQIPVMAKQLISKGYDVEEVNMVASIRRRQISKGEKNVKVSALVKTRIPASAIPKDTYCSKFPYVVKDNLNGNTIKICADGTVEI